MATQIVTDFLWGFAGLVLAATSLFGTGMAYNTWSESFGANIATILLVLGVMVGWMFITFGVYLIHRSGKVQGKLEAMDAEGRE